MKAFALTWDGATFNNLMVATCPDLDTAKAAIDAARAAAGIAAASAEDLNLSGPSLAVLHNKLLDTAVEGDNTENHVSRFATRLDGQRRVFGLLETHFKNAPEAAAPSPVDTNAATTETTTNEDDMATKGKKAKKAKAVKAPRAPKTPKKEAKGVDQFGLRKDSKNSQAAAMFARAKGATMADVKEAVGDTFYGMLGKLQDAGHKVKKDGKTIFLIAK